MITFQNLEIGFSQKSKNKTLFQTGTMQFSPGDFVGIVGPNGSGKTTLFTTLLGENPPISGTFLWGARDLQQLSRQESVKCMSFVSSKFDGVNHLTVYELIAMGRAPYTNILNRLQEEDHQKVAAIIKQLGLEEIQNKNTLHLSDGERQIAMIGKALAQETSIIILDEPTAFLDFNNRRKILELLKTIAEEEKKIVFLSSHNLDLCFQFCNRIIAINKHEKQLESYVYPFDSTKIIDRIFS